MSDVTVVWVFNGVRSMFPSGVFSSREIAKEWIRRNALTGTLTQYPLDLGMYEYAIAAETFTPRKPDHSTSEFIGKFSGGGITHFHYEAGLPGCAG